MIFKRKNSQKRLGKKLLSILLIGSMLLTGCSTSGRGSSSCLLYTSIIQINQIVIKILSQMGIIKRVQIQIKTTIITKIRIKITKKNIKVGTTGIIQNVQTAKK